MNEDLNKTVGDDSSVAPGAVKNSHAELVKRRRGWLGVKSSIETHNFGGSNEPLIEVDAPNGWNR